MASGVMVFAEQREGSLKGVSLECLSAGKRLAEKSGEGVSAVLMGSGVEGLTSTLAEYGADRIFLSQSEMLEQYNGEAYARILSDIINENQPSIVLMGATAVGRDLAPRVAAKLGTGLAADCIDLSVGDDGILVQTRPVYAGKAICRIVSPEARPQMATVRPNNLPLDEPVSGREAEIVSVEPRLSADDIHTRVLEVIRSASTRPELTEARVIVSGGRGLGGPENFRLIEELADVLGAAVGASRAAVDAGWREHEFQVGQTGKVVTPELYIACGISGAIQHLAGMGSSKVILAVNKDPNATIFKVATYGIVGDLFEVIPRLTEEFRELLSQS